MFFHLIGKPNWLSGLWLAKRTRQIIRHFRLPLWNCWTEFNESWWEASSQRPLPSLCFLWPDRIKKMAAPFLIGWNIFDFSCPLPSLCFLGADQKTKMVVPAFDWLKHFRLLLWNRWTEFKELNRKQDLNLPYQVCVFGADQKTKMAILAYDWLRYLCLLLWKCWTELKETWQEERSQCPLLSLCFLSWLENQHCHLGLWLAETFSTSPLKPWAELKESWQEARSQRLYFQSRSENLDASASEWLRHFWHLLWNCWTEFNDTWQEARS